MAIVLIPARMESLRFPGKPLAPILGVPMVIRCAHNSKDAGLEPIICTDSDLIIDVVASKYQINSIKTPNFNTGTDRVHWSAHQIQAEKIINLQGDEPLISPDALNKFAKHIDNCTSTKPLIINGLSVLQQKKAFDPNNVKAVINNFDEVVYLSRKPLRNSQDSSNDFIYLKQLGLYGFSIDALNQFSSCEQTRLEKAESIEMLRWIEHRNTLSSLILDTPSISVDTPEDLAEVEHFLALNK